MILIILALIASAYVSYMIWEDERSIFTSIFAAIVAFLLFSLIIMGISNFECEIRNRNNDYIKTKSQFYKIVSLKDNITTTGNFFLGSGHIEGNMKYFVYVDYGNNTYKIKKYDVDDSLIKESNIKSEDAKIEKISYYCKPSIVMFPASDSLVVNVKTKYIIHVPMGTIIKQMVLNGE